MSKTFSQRSSEAFLIFTKSALRRTIKTHQRVLTDCFEKNFEKKQQRKLSRFERLNFEQLLYKPVFKELLFADFIKK